MSARRLSVRGSVLIHAGIVFLCLVFGGSTDVWAQDICANGASRVNPLAASVPGAPGEGGIGGTGISTVRRGAEGTGGGDGGIGGTGILAEGSGAGRSDGIGGTGIVGVITGFASICVNGVEVHFDASTPVVDGSRPSSAGQLAVGQLVALHASGSGGQLTARNIALIHTAQGPLQAMDARTGAFRVLGQSGRLRARIGPADLVSGDWVRVSGQRMADGEIDATRMERVAPQSSAQLNGAVTRVEGDTLFIGTTPVRFERQSWPVGLTVGKEVTVSGYWDGRSLRARQVLVDPTRASVGRVSRVVLEGYIHSLDPHRVNLGFEDLLIGQDMQLVGARAGKLAVNQHVQVTGRVGPDEKVVLDRIMVRDDRADGARGYTGPPRSSERQRERTSSESGELSGRGEAAKGAERTDGAHGSERSDGSDGSGGGNGAGDSDGSQGSDGDSGKDD